MITRKCPPKAQMIVAREQLMEDIKWIVESVSSQYIDNDDIEWNTIEIDHEDLIRKLCAAVRYNFPIN